MQAGWRINAAVRRGSADAAAGCQEALPHCRFKKMAIGRIALPQWSREEQTGHGRLNDESA